MRDHRDAALALHPLDQRAAAARHDDVDSAGHASASGRPPRGRWSARAGSRPPAGRPRAARVQAGEDRARGMEAFGAAAQDRRVAGLEAQPAGVGGHVGAALVDDADDAERHATREILSPFGRSTRRGRARPDRAVRRCPRDPRPSRRCASGRASAGRAAPGRCRLLAPRRCPALASRISLSAPAPPRRPAAAPVLGLGRGLGQRRGGSGARRPMASIIAARSPLVRLFANQLSRSSAAGRHRRRSTPDRPGELFLRGHGSQNSLDFTALVSGDRRASRHSNRPTARGRSRSGPRAHDTASPRSKPPSTAMTPAGSRLLPRRAPDRAIVDDSAPAGFTAPAIHACARRAARRLAANSVARAPASKRRGPAAVDRDSAGVIAGGRRRSASRSRPASRCAPPRVW